MTITFFTNFINHHQVPVADEFYKLLGANYTFVSTEPMPQRFKENGYPEFSDKQYLLNSYESREKKEIALSLGLNSDIVIIGSAPEEFVKERLKKNKITFRYSERWFKKNHKSLFSPRAWFYFWENHIKYRNKNLYMLCASAYTAGDVAKVFAYPDKCYKWGYFTKINAIEIDGIIKNKQQDCLKMFWISRWIDWKHPELPIQLAIELKKKGYDFQIEMAGDGILKEDILKQISENNLSDNISILGVLSNDLVLKKMQDSNLFLFTSDRNEGWGAVLNEAMSNGCAIVASHEIGSVPFLIEDEKNGLVFKSKDVISLVDKVELLLKNREMCNALARNAYLTVKDVWSPQNAASNFLDLAQSLIQGNEITSKYGPCSKAGHIKNGNKK